MNDFEAEAAVAGILEERGLSQASVLDYMADMRRFARYMGGMDDALAATAADVDAWLADMRRTRSERGVYRSASRVKGLFGHLWKVGVIPEDPFRSISSMPSFTETRGYDDAVTLPEIKAIIAEAYRVCENPDATRSSLMLGVVALLHVRYCIPLHSIARMRVRDYLGDPRPAAVVWTKLSTMEPCCTELDKRTAACIEAHLNRRGGPQPDDPLFARLAGKGKGDFYSGATPFPKLCELYAAAGVRVGYRELKLAAIEYAAECGASTEQIRAMAASVGMNMAYVTSKRQARAPLREISALLDIEMGSESPTATGRVDVADLKAAIKAAGKAKQVPFTVTFDGRLVFPEGEKRR